MSDAFYYLCKYSTICGSEIVLLETLFILSMLKSPVGKLHLATATLNPPPSSSPLCLTFSSALYLSLLLESVTHHHYLASISHLGFFSSFFRTCGVPCSKDHDILPSISDTKYKKLHFVPALLYLMETILKVSFHKFSLNVKLSVDLRQGQNLCP